MEYKGKLYGHLGGKMYFDTGKTADDWDTLEKRVSELEAENQALHQPPVSGSLPMYEVEELNEIVKLLNSKEINLYTCIGMVWNKAYLIGANEGMKAGQLGNDH